MTLTINIKKILSLPVFAALIFILLVASSIVIVRVADTGTDSSKENDFPIFEVPTATTRTTIYAITQVENNQYTLSPLSGDPPCAHPAQWRAAPRRSVATAVSALLARCRFQQCCPWVPVRLSQRVYR